MGDGIVDLWRLTILFRIQATNLAFTFSGQNMAKSAYAKARGAKKPTDEIEIEDQFGNQAVFLAQDMLCPVLTHVQEDLNGSTAMALVQARAQAKAQREAAADLSINSKIVTLGARPAA